MNDAQALLLNDLTILENMLDELPEYLQSDATRWPLQYGSPPMTIGGCLMRIQRLGKLFEQIPVLDQQRYHQAVDAYHAALEENVVRFEKRVHQELRARLSEWSICLRELHHDGVRYANKVDTRVVIAEMMWAMEKRPYQLQPQTKKEIQALDNNLKNRWSPGEFVWDAVWQPAYAAETYWWLYGMPAAIAVP